MVASIGSLAMLASLDGLMFWNSISYLVYVVFFFSRKGDPKSKRLEIQCVDPELLNRKGGGVVNIVCI